MIGGPWQRGLLVSVRTADEARAAVVGGATIIDVKEPGSGPLGRASPQVTAEILAAVAGRIPVTLACGELADGVEPIADHLREVCRLLTPALTAPVAVKAGPAGLAAECWVNAFERLASALPEGIELVAVAYADHEHALSPAPGAILAAAQAAGAATVLIDTCDKAGPGLFELVSADAVGRWAADARRDGLWLALAGRLTAGDLERAVRLGCDVVGVRSAACVGGRAGRIDADLVARLVAATRRRRVFAP